MRIYQRTRRFGLSRSARLLACATCALAWSCGDAGPGASGTARRGAAKVGGDVVSTVDGHPIRVADIEAVVRASSLGPREALERLQAELLLIAEAERRGVSGRKIDATAVRAGVHALLDKQAAANAASDEEVRAAFEIDPRFHKLDRRASIHVLARAKQTAKPEEIEAARKVAAAAIADLENLSYEELKARYASSIGSVAVKVERLPAVDKQSTFVAEFLAALFSLDAPGVVPQPVQTQFGWHAIRVTEVLPEEHTPYEQAEPVLREEISIKKQTQAMNELLADLRRAHPVEMMQDVDDKLAVVDGAEEVGP